MGYGLPDTENFAAPQTPDPVANMFGGGGMFDEPAPPQHTEITAKIGQPSSQNPNPSSAFAMSNFGTIPKSFDDWIADPQNVQKIPTRPIVAGQTGKSFAGMALATALDSIGSAISGNKPTVGANWNSQVQAGREYDREAPAMQQQANQAAYGKYLGNENTRSEINQRNMINPFYQNAQKEIGELSQAWQSGIAPDAFDKMVQLKQSTSPYARFITPQVLQQIKGLPQQPPKFTVGPNGIEPITWRGQNYGVTPTPGEDPIITQARQLAIDAQKQNETSKQDLKAGEFKPEVIAQLGKPPLGNPAAMAEYGKKAEAIETRMSAAPKLQVINAGMGDPNSPEHQALVAAVAGGKMQLSEALPRAATEQQRAAFAKDVQAVNPNWSSADFDITKKVREGFTSGADSNTLQAFNTAIKHMKTFTDMADALKNGDTQALNKMGQAYNTQFGSDAATNFNIAKTAFSGEVGKAFAGANVGEGDRKELAEQINSASSPAQLKGAAATALMLLNGKKEALQAKYDAGVKGEANFGGGSSSDSNVIEYVRDSSGKLVPKGKK